MIHAKRTLALFLLVICCFACHTSHTEVEAQPGGGGSSPSATKEAVPLRIELREGQPVDSKAEKEKVAQATPLSPTRVEALLKMFTEPLEDEKERPEFFQRPSSKPAPTSAVPKEMPFPPIKDGGQAPEVTAKGLKVLSISPEGALDRAPRLSISFSTPMISVSDPESAEQGDPLGIKLEPRPAGKWRWIGTQTLVFEPEGAEFPRATEYKVTVPAGIKDVNGSALSSSSTQTFTLPRPSVQSFYPSGSGYDTEPLVYVVFDQPVDPGPTLKLLHLVKGSEEIGLTRLSEAEAEAKQKGVTNANKDILNKRVFYFKPARKLDPGTSYTITVEKGIKSAEGPLLSEQPQSSSFSTYDPLVLSSCYPQEGEEISPFGEFYLSFNNQLDEKKFDPKWIEVTPKIENLKVIAQGSSIRILGAKNGRTTYTVSVSPQLIDTWKQTLGKKLTLQMKTGSAPKALSHGVGTFTVMEPGVAPGIPIFTTNIPKLDLLVYKVKPEQWSEYLKFLYDYNRAYTPEDKKKLRPPGEKVVEKSVKLVDKADQLVTTRLDLSEYFADGEGNLVVWVRDPDEDRERYRSREFLSWLQATKLGVDIEVGPQKTVAMVTTLADGKPVSGAKVSLGQSGGTTSADGSVVIDTPAQTSPVLMVEGAGSKAFIPHSTSPWSSGGGWSSRSLIPEQRWFLFDDRGLYKPGEKATVKGYIRAWHRGPNGQLKAAGAAGDTVTWELKDPRGNKLKEGTAKLDAYSGIEINLEFPPDTNLGSHSLTINGNGLTNAYHALNVQEFRRPEFEVTAKVVSDQPHLLLGSATIEAGAAYFAGGPLPNSDVNWTINTMTAHYTPPGRTDYSFGQWTPWWDLGYWWDSGSRSGGNGHYSYQGKTDTEGKHLLAMDFLEVWPPQPTTVSITASVADVNRQQQASTTSLIVHPSERYVGLKVEKSFVDEKSDFQLETIVTDIDGNMLPGISLEVNLYQVEFEYQTGIGYRQSEKLIDSETLTSAAGPSKVTLSSKAGGTFKIRAVVKDDKGRLNQSEYTVWKAGGELPSSDKVELENLTLVPDRKEYEPGQSAKILVMAPFSEGEGLVSWERDGLLREERFTLKNGTATVEQPITAEMIPNVRASITVVGKAKWGKRERPAVAGGQLDLSISTAQRKLTLEIHPSRDKLEPGAEVDVPVTVKDYQGKAVSGARVTLWIVDEALLGLTGYSTPNPLSTYYYHRPNQLTPHHNRTFIALADPQMEGLSASDASQYDGVGGLVEGGAAPPPAPSAAPAKVMRAKAATRNEMVAQASPAMEMDQEEAKADMSGQAQNFTVRKNFDALASYSGELATNASGQTTVKVKLPDNLTRYRVMAVAVKEGDLFGSADSLLTARLPVMVRPSLPRFLNFGDRAKLPVVVQNQTDQPMKVELVGEANGVTWIGPSGMSVDVPANNRVEVQFEAEATEVGIAHFRFGATAGKFNDAATLTLPVYTPASGEAFATYGNIGDNGAVKQPVRRPGDVWSQFGGLDISLSSTALSELTDAFLYLYEYPYECSEQKSSRMLSIAAMGDVLSAFNPNDIPSKDALKARMKADTVHLERMQNSDGGWEYWRRDEDSEPFVSLHVMHALVRAKAEGYEVNQQTLDRGLSYLKEIEAKCRAKKYGEYGTRSCKAYALYIQNLMGKQDVEAAKKLFTVLSKEKNPDLDAIGWLWPTLSRHAKGSPELGELKRQVLNRATETADKAQFTTSFGEGDNDYLLLYSSRRTDAILLAGLLQDDPKNPLNTKLVRGLLAHREKGRWSNTQENIWILLALQSYFREYEKETPSFLASLWLDGKYLGEEKFEGRTAKEGQLHIPMEKLSDKDQDLIVAKNGTGRLYYRIGMKYAPKSLRLPAENRGFTVERSYKGLDSESDVKQLENGDWEVKAGAKVEVTLTMVCPERRYHVALVDQLPAGLEPLNPVLKGTPPTSHGGEVSRGGRGWYWWWRWYQHENLRDERVEAFSQLVYPGVYTYTYTAIATTPGEYVLPPLKAEEMYSPEVFGRTATGRFFVK